MKLDFYSQNYIYIFLKSRSNMNDCEMNIIFRAKKNAKNIYLCGVIINKLL